jgi:hypothetical protein
MLALRSRVPFFVCPFVCTFVFSVLQQMWLVLLFG